MADPLTIDATDLTFNAGPGGLGLGSPWDWTNPAIQSDIKAGYSPQPFQIPALTSPAPAGSNDNSPSASTGATTNTNPGATDVAAAGVAGTAQNYFMRALVIVTGFIFLAVGLSMLRPSVMRHEEP